MGMKLQKRSIISVTGLGPDVSLAIKLGCSLGLQTFNLEICHKYLQSMTIILDESQKARCRTLDAWMVHHLLPENLRERILFYKQYKWLETRGVDGDNLIHILRKDLKDIKSHLCLTLLMRVMKGSPAEQAGILHGDVIVQCGQKDVQSFLEFFDIIWKMVGKTVEVVVVRESSAAPLILKVMLMRPAQTN